MRKLMLVLAAVALLAAGVIAPANAAPADKTTYITGECYSAAPQGTPWSTGQVSHWNGTVQYMEFLYNANTHGWVGPIGTEQIQVYLASNAQGTTMHGTYVFDSPVMGDFAGTWSQGHATLGHASGRSTDGTGRIALTTMSLDQSQYPMPFDGCFGFQVNEWLVITP